MDTTEHGGQAQAPHWSEQAFWGVAAGAQLIPFLALVVGLTLLAVQQARGGEGRRVSPTPVSPGSVESATRDPFVPAVSVETLVRSDAHGVLGSGLEWGPATRPLGSLRIGGTGDIDGHEPMSVFGVAGGRVDDVGLSALLAADWIGGSLSHWIAGARLSWWPDLQAAGHPAEVWVEYGGGALRFGVHAEGQADWLIVGGSAWIDSRKTAGVDLYLGAVLDVVRFRLGVLHADGTAPPWWGRGSGGGDPSLYLSVGWRG